MQITPGLPPLARGLTQASSRNDAGLLPAPGTDEVLLSDNPPPPDAQYGMKPEIREKNRRDQRIEHNSRFPRKRFYHGYEATVQQLRDMAARHPDRALLQAIGKTYEGRQIWALKITRGAPNDASDKPAVVMTGLHHAREWMTVESTLKLADALLEGYATDPAMRHRVDHAETWIVPIVNPDGYEYSREANSAWRKNRTPQDGGWFGVDINRNYYDPAHPELYRLPSDSAQSTDDDIGASDDPSSEAFRGPSGNSERETNAMRDLVMRPNVVGVLDHHSYGEMILRPPNEVVTNATRLKNYDEIGRRMKAAQSKPYSYIPTDQLYPTTGDSGAVFEKHGRYGMVIEMGTSFRPDGHRVASVTKEVVAADLAFIDAMIEVSGGKATS